jgi:hypothetical protein
VIVWLLPVALLLAMASPAAAQNDKRWGVAFSFTPEWKGDSKLAERLFGLEGWDLEGTEVTIGVARGTARGGYWSANFVQKPFKDGLSLVESETFCSGPNNQFCSSQTSSRVMQNVRIRGVEFDFLIPVATFANRVQVGVNVGGGAGFPEGTVATEITFTNSGPGQPTQTFADRFDEDAKDVLYSVVPLVKVAVQGSVFIAPGLRANVMVGMNTPSAVSARVGAVYFFGSN